MNRGTYLADESAWTASVNAWMAFTDTFQMDPYCKWEGPGRYSFGGYLDCRGRGFITVTKEK